jgi:transposase
LLQKFVLFLQKFLEIMRILQTKPYLTDNELYKLMNSQKDVFSFRDYQIIYSVQTNFGKKAEDLSGILCVTKNKIYKTVQKYNRFGISWKDNKSWGGRREKRCHLPLEEEKLLLKSLEDDALSGKILTFKHIKEQVDNRVGKKVSDDYIWDLFSRHGWTKKVPRPHHPKADKAAQETFKKNSKKIWLPSH